MENYGNLWVIFNPALLAQAKDLEVPSRRNPPFLPHRNCVRYDPKEPCNSNSPTKSLNQFSISHTNYLSLFVISRKGICSGVIRKGKIVFMVLSGDSQEAVASRLRALRMSRGLDQTELAKLVGIGQSQISMMETGERGLSPRNAKKFIKVFRVDWNWLYEGDTTNVPKRLHDFIYGGKEAPSPNKKIAV